MNKKGIYSLLIVLLVVFIGAIALLATTYDGNNNLLTGSVVFDAESKSYSDCINVQALKLTEYENVDMYCKCKSEEKKGCELYLKKKAGVNCDAGYLPEYQCEINSKQLPTLYQKYQLANCNSKFVPVKTCQTACAGNNCADDACTDSDGGNNPYLNGVTKGNDKFNKHVEFTDWCASPDGVREFYCRQNQVADTYYSCSFGCDAVKGECKKASCSDSDEGQAIYIKGTTKGAVFGQPIDVTTEKEDACANSKQLREYYCHETGAVSSVLVDCSNGCSDGKCNPPGKN